eukprot:TRINITY_DN51737_c0_g2_i1.p1 TRINITY_DN51737_c0_g2~~TRINITY_DN51737_c0_g2_i1.p1  ORF type:complete len:573 (-),score=119.11 TRINITY_DN51737_c0_g2_i1:93-1811(-)
MTAVEGLREHFHQLVSKVGLQTVEQKSDYIGDYIARWGAGKRQVNFQQFVQSLRSLHIPADRAEEAFYEIDLNGNGVLDVKELSTALFGYSVDTRHGAINDANRFRPGEKITESSKWHKCQSGGFGKSSLHKVGACVINAQPLDFTREKSPWEPQIKGTKHPCGYGPHPGVGGIRSQEAHAWHHCDRHETFPGGGFGGGSKPTRAPKVPLLPPLAEAQGLLASRSAPQLAPAQHGVPPSDRGMMLGGSQMAAGGSSGSRGSMPPSSRLQSCRSSGSLAPGQQRQQAPSSRGSRPGSGAAMQAMQAAPPGFTCPPSALAGASGRLKTPSALGSHRSQPPSTGGRRPPSDAARRPTPQAQLSPVPEAQAGVAPMQPHGSPAQASHPMLEDLRYALMNTAGSAGLHVFGNLLGDLADDGSGQLPRVSAPVLEAALDRLGMRLNPEDLELILQAAGMDASGSISIDDLLVAIRGPVAHHREAMVQKIWSMLDPDNQGAVSVEALSQYFDGGMFPDVMAGQVPAQEAFNIFLSQLDGPRRCGGVTREEFLEYFRNVSAALPDDDLFARVMHELWRVG